MKLGPAAGLALAVAACAQPATKAVELATTPVIIEVELLEAAGALSERCSQ